jgi:hypothetical protein
MQGLIRSTIGAGGSRSAEGGSHVVLVFRRCVYLYDCRGFGRRRFGFLGPVRRRLLLLNWKTLSKEKTVLVVFLIATFIFTLGIALLVGVAEM